MIIKYKYVYVMIWYPKYHYDKSMHISTLITFILLDYMNIL